MRNIMILSLSKARLLEKRISKQIQAKLIESSHIFSNQMTVVLNKNEIDKVIAKLQESEAKINLLNVETQQLHKLRYKLRQRIAKANEAYGMTEKLNQAAEIQARLSDLTRHKSYSELRASNLQPTFDSYDDLKSFLIAKAEVLRETDKSDMSISLALLSQFKQDSAKEFESLQKSLQKIQDEIAEQNALIKVDLSDFTIEEQNLLLGE